MLEREIARAAKEIERSEFSSFELTYWTKDIFTTREEEIAREAIERLSTFLKKLGYVVNILRVGKPEAENLDIYFLDCQEKEKNKS